MKVVQFVAKFFYLIYLALEYLFYYVLDRIDKTILFAGKVLAIVAPIAIYNVLDNMYAITPKLTIYAMGLINLCLSLLS